MRLMLTVLILSTVAIMRVMLTVLILPTVAIMRVMLIILILPTVAIMQAMMIAERYPGSCCPPEGGIRHGQRTGPGGALGNPADLPCTPRHLRKDREV